MSDAQRCYDLLASLDLINREHSVRVGKLAFSLANRLKQKHIQICTNYFSYVLHDVGKIKIPKDILLKNDKLSTEEFNQIKLHTVYGQSLLKGLGADRSAISVALFHHENWDGSGYPFGLSGTAIPIEARLCRIVDSYDVITSRRAYKEKGIHEDAIEDLVKHKATWYDPDLINFFQEVMKTCHL